MDLTGWLSDFLEDYRTRELEEEVWARSAQNLLDGIVAVISGSQLKPGLLAQEFVRSRAASGGATVAGAGFATAPELAALANGMSAHSDETDDANDLARIHPAASIVPAALALAEARGVGGERLLRAVSAGYDVGCGIVLTAWEPGTTLRQSVQSTHGVGQLFGAAAASAVVSELPAGRLRHVISYTAQQAAGFSSFFRDSEHIEKSFAMGGRQAHDGVRAVEFVDAGFTAVDDVLDGRPNFFDAFGKDGDPSRLPKEVDRRHLLTSDTKQFSVGMPIQAAAQALKEILRTHPVTWDDVERIEAHLPAEKAGIVDSRLMPSIHLQYVLAVLLEDGRLTFANTHDYERHESPEMRALIERVTLIHDPELNPPAKGEGTTRRAIVRVIRKQGDPVEVRVDPLRGSRENPLTWEEVAEKSRDVLSGTLKDDAIEGLIRTVRDLRSARDLGGLCGYLVVPGGR